MKYLIYISQASRAMSHDDLLALLETSRIRNQQNKITGLLLYKGSPIGDDTGYFMQLLEGPLDEVTATQKRIELDDRHKSLLVLEDGDVEARTFPSWSMGFRHVDEEKLAKFDGYADLGSPDFWDRAQSGNTKDALEMMRFFSKEDV